MECFPGLVRESSYHQNDSIKYKYIIMLVNHLSWRGVYVR